MDQYLIYEELPIYDNIHGFVRVTELEKKLINNIYFQRLREIKQLSFAYYVFPGAQHSRFSHSIGVLAITIKILSRIKELDKESFDGKDMFILRLAALLHDIGHYPFSHMVEQVYIKNLNNKDKAMSENLGRNICNHEALGAYIIMNTDFDGGITRELLEGGITLQEIEEISLIIQGKSKCNWFNQVLHSDLDADRLDYLLRDSISSGVVYGNFDLDYLINSCRLVKNKESGEKTFAISSYAFFSVEHFLLSRYFWYAQIICNRSISIFNRMGEIVYGWLLENGRVYDIEDIKKLIKEGKSYDFFKFNDIYFWDKIYWLLEEKEVESMKASAFYKEMASMLLYRKTLKRVPINIKKQLIPKDGEDNLSMFSHNIQFMKEEFNKLFKDLQGKLRANQIDDKWVVQILDKVTIFNLYNEENENSKRDRIKIVSEDNNIKNLDQQPHSIISLINKNDIVIPRIYVKEEYERYLGMDNYDNALE